MCFEYSNLTELVANVKGSMVVAEREYHRITRNSSHFKVIKSKDQIGDYHSDSEDDDLTNDLDQSQPDVQLKRRCPLRQRTAPQRLAS